MSVAGLCDAAMSKSLSLKSDKLLWVTVILSDLIGHRTLYMTIRKADQTKITSDRP